LLDGVRLTLMVGPAAPAPAPREVLDALDSVQVTSAAGERSGFQLSFTLSSRSPLHTLFMLTGGSSIPLLRLVLVATVNGVAEVLVDGVMTHHEVSPGPDPAHPTLTVTGEDLTRVMDYIDFSGVPYPGMPAEARVALILAKYATFGVVPMIVPSILLDVPIPVERIPRQQGTDFAYVTCLAERVGYVFYVEGGPAPGTSVAYWGPELRVGVPQPALNVDWDAHTNVGSMGFRYDASQATMPVLYIHEPTTKAVIPVPVPSVTPLSPPLGAVPPIPQRFEPVEGTAKLSMLQAAAIALTKAARSGDVVTGSGSLDVLRYGRVLRARRLVGVRGAGTAFDGLWFVKSVTSRIQRGEFVQDFTLVRNGLVSTVARVAA
jgi:hypothetical protein